MPSTLRRTEESGERGVAIMVDGKEEEEEEEVEEGKGEWLMGEDGSDWIEGGSGDIGT